LVKNFVEMGFTEARSKKALVFFKNNFESAMAYMLNNDESRDAVVLREEVRFNICLTDEALGDVTHDTRFQTPSLSSIPGK